MVSSCHRWWVVEFIISPYHHQHWGPCICRRWWPSTTHTQQTHVNNKPTKSLCASSKSAFGCREFIILHFHGTHKIYEYLLMFVGYFSTLFSGTQLPQAFYVYIHTIRVSSSFARAWTANATFGWQKQPTGFVALRDSAKGVPGGHVYMIRMTPRLALSLSCSNECINSISDALTSRS